MNKLSLAVPILLTFAVTAAQATGDAQAGKAKSAACIACHGPDGNSPTNPLWPKLAGQHPGYIKKQLVAFRSGARMNQVMAPMAAPLKDQDIEDLARITKWPVMQQPGWLVLDTPCCGHGDS